MNDNSTLGLLFEISADPSKAVEALGTLDTAAAASSERIQQAMGNAKIALDQGLGEAMARTQLVAAGLSEEAAKLAVAEMQVATSTKAASSETTAWATALGTVRQGLSQAEVETTNWTKALGSSSREMEYSTQQARMTGMELESMFGLRVPRAINTFLARLEFVGPAMAAAFSGIAILGIIDLLATQVPVAFDKAVGALTGWDKEAKKDFEAEIALNERYVQSVKKIQDKLIDLKVEYGELTHVQGETQKINADQAELDRQNDIIDKTQKAIAYKKEFQEAGESAAFTGMELPDPRSLDELTKALETARKKAADLDLALREMRQAEIPKATAEDTRKWFTEQEQLAKQYQGLSQAQVEATKRTQDAILATKEAAAKTDFERRAIDEQQYTETLKRIEAERTASEMAALAQRRNLEEASLLAAGKGKSEELVKIDTDIEVARQQHQTRLQQIDAQSITRQREQADETLRIATEGSAKQLEIEQATIKSKLDIYEQDFRNLLDVDTKVALLREQMAAKALEISSGADNTESADSKQRELYQLNQIIAKTQEAIDYKRQFEQSGKSAAFAGTETPDTRPIEELSRALEDAQQKTHGLDQALRAMQHAEVGGPETEALRQRLSDITNQVIQSQEDAVQKWYSAQSETLKRTEEQYKRSGDTESDGYKQVLDRMNALDEDRYGKQSDILQRGLDEAKRLFGAQSPEYKALLDRLASLDEEWYRNHADTLQKAADEFKRQGNTQSDEYRQVLARIAALDAEHAARVEQTAERRLESQRNIDDQSVRSHAEAIQREAQQELDRLNVVIAATRQAIETKKEFQGLGNGPAFTGIQAPDPRSFEELNRILEESKTRAAELGAALEKMRQSGDNTDESARLAARQRAADEARIDEERRTQDAIIAARAAAAKTEFDQKIISEQQYTDLIKQFDKERQDNAQAALQQKHDLELQAQRERAQLQAGTSKTNETQTELDHLNAIIAKTEEAIRYKKELEESSKGTAFPGIQPPDPRSFDELTKALSDAQEKAHQLHLALKDLSSTGGSGPSAEPLQRELDQLNQVIHKTEQAIAQKKEFEKPGESVAITGAAPDTRSFEELGKVLADAQHKAAGLERTLQDLKQSGTGGPNTEALQQQLASLTDQMKQYADSRKTISESLTSQVIQSEESAINAWYTKQRTAMDQAAAEMKRLFGELSPEHKKVLDQMAKLDDERTLKLQQAAQRQLEDQKKLDAESVQFHNEATRAYEEASKRSEDEITRDLDRSTKERIRVILEASKLQAEAEQKEADAHLRYWQTKDREFLASHQISVQQFVDNERTALQQWYDAQSAILQRQIDAAKSAYVQDESAYQKLIQKKEQLDQQYLQKSTQIDSEEEQQTRRVMNEHIRLYQQAERIGLDMFSHLRGASKIWADTSVKMIDEIMLAILQKDLQEQKGIMVTAALKAKMQAAEAIAAFASGNLWAGAEHTLAAAAFGALAAEPIISAAIGASEAGRSSGGGGGGGYGGPGGYGGGSGVGVPLAAGGGAPGGTLHVVIMGESEQANYFAGMLTNGVRNGSIQLVASSTTGG